MQTARRTWLTLLAGVATAASVAAQQQPPADSPSAAGPPPPVDGVETPGREWQLPPVHVSGSLSYDLRASRGGGEGSSLSQLVTASLAARTFIFQPWFATVGGTLNLSSDWTRRGFDDAGTASLSESIKSREQFITGTGRLDVFAQSRFPFEAHVERSDSRIDSGLASSLDFRTQDLGFSQRYRPLSGAFDATGSYDHREQSGLGFNAKQDTVSGDFGTRWRANELNLGASFSRARSIGVEDDSRFASLVARHQYAPGNALSVNTTANWTRTQESLPTAPSDLKVLQVSSVGLWHGEGSPLTLTGSGRYLSLREDLAGTALDSAGATLGANYELNPNLRLTGNAGVSTTRSGGSNALGFTGSVGAAYQGDTVPLAGGRYDWFASGSAGAAANDGTRLERERQTSLNLQLGHSFARNWALGAQSTLGLNAAQTLSWNDNQSNLHAGRELGLGSSRTLLNTLAGTWQTGGSDRSAYARASYSDAMELGRDNRFQLFNFQLSGNFELDNRRSLGGDLTWQRTSQQIDSVSTGGDVTLPGRSSSRAASGEITYRHQRPFGIARLRFISRLKLAQDVLKQPGILLSLPDRETRLWENRLDYSIGRIETQLVLRIAQVDGRRRESLMFRVQRSFGD